MVNLSLNELKLTAKFRVIKDYESMSEDKLLSALNASESLKESENNSDETKPKIIFFKSKIEEISKKFNELRHEFSKSKINKIRRNLYEIENKKNNSSPKIKKIEKNLHELEKNLNELEKNLSKRKTYFDHDFDTEYKGIRDVKDLFDLSIDEDYY